MAEAKKYGQEKSDPEKQRISCRYFVRGFCREGNKCQYSHERCDIPAMLLKIAAVFYETYNTGQCFCMLARFVDTINKVHAIMEKAAGSSILKQCLILQEVDTPSLSSINLLMAAAISTAVADNNSIEPVNETPNDPISAEKAIVMWKNFIEGDHNVTCDSNKFFDNSDNNLSAVDEMSLFFNRLETFNIKHWSVGDAIDLMCVIADFEDVDDISEDYYTGNALYDLLRLWKPTSKILTDFLCTLCELKQIDMAELLICFVRCPYRLDEFDCYLGEVLFHMYERKPNDWNETWIANLLGKLESDVDCCDVDVVDLLSSFGQLLKEPGKLGKLAHTYLLATGLQNSFECRCRTAECVCPVEVDEGVAFILFDGLGRRLQWNKSDKTTFFCQAVDGLFIPSILSQLGESMGIRNAGDICNYRLEITNNTLNQPKYTKCPSSNCSNMAKRDCVNNLCGRCCKRSGLWCDVHIDLFPTRYQSVHAHDLLKPRVHLARREALECFLEAKEEAQAVCFGSEFAVRDDDVMKVIDLCKQLLVLELGSSDSGCGSDITDLLLDYIAEHCRMLRKLRLASARRVTDDALLKVMKNCQHLESLEVSGNDKCSGRVTDRVVKALFDRNVLPNLKILYLADQPGVSYDLVMRLRRCRSNIEITAGYTDSDSMAWSLILGMTGASYGDGLF